MKIAEKIAEVTTNFPAGDTVEMSVDSASMAHIMNTLTDMYQNPWEALGRELISNSLDAHAEQNGLQVTATTVFPKPVEVTLPTDLNPEFIVKDYGIGMSRDTLMNVFPRYGASTKRGSNDQIGGFGLGAKTPFAVSENFIVETVHNGKKNTAVFQKNERGIGEGMFLPEQDTDAENGTIIRVTLRNSYRLNEAFRDNNLLMGFPAGSILVDGKEPQVNIHNTEQFTPLPDSLGWMRAEPKNPGHYRPRISPTAIIGTVAYKVDGLFSNTASKTDTFDPDTMRTFAQNVVLNIPIGTVDLTPSRDSLIFSNRTITALSDLYLAAKDAYVAVVQEQVDAVETDVEAVQATITAREKFHYSDTMPEWTRDGQVIPAKPARYTVPEDMAAHYQALGSRRGETGQPTFIQRGQIIITGADDLEDAQTLAKGITRFRKGGVTPAGKDLADIHATVLFLVNGDLDSYSRWEQAHIKNDALMILTKDEYLTVVEAGRQVEREQARRRRAEKAEVEKATVETLAVSLYRHHRINRISLKQAEAENVAYVSLNAEDGTLANKYAQMDARDSIYSVVNDIASAGNHRFGIILLPKNVSLQAILDTYPNLKSVDEYLRDLSNKEQDLQELGFQAAVSSSRFGEQAGWLFLPGMTDEKIAQIVNPDLQAWAVKARTVASSIYKGYYLTRGMFLHQNNISYDSSVFTNRDGFTEAYQAHLDAIPTFPLLASIAQRTEGDDTTLADEVIEYLNFKNQA